MNEIGKVYYQYLEKHVPLRKEEKSKAYEIGALKDISPENFVKHLKNSTNPKSTIIRLMMAKSRITNDILASYLGIAVQSLKNKLTIGSFSIDDLVQACYASNFSIIIKDNMDGTEYEVSPEDYILCDKNYELKKNIDAGDLKKKNYISVAIDACKKEFESLKAQYEDLKATLMDLPVAELNLSVHSCDCLAHAQINTVRDICRIKSHNDLIKIRNLGRESVEEITNKMREIGLDETACPILRE